MFERKIILNGSKVLNKIRSRFNEQPLYKRALFDIKFELKDIKLRLINFFNCF